MVATFGDVALSIFGMGQKFDIYHYQQNECHNWQAFPGTARIFTHR